MLRPLLALVRFHYRAGVRVSVKATAPVVGAAVAGAAIIGPGFVLGIAAMVLASGLGPLLVALASYLLARVSWPRMALGQGGWIVHLPASGATHRRAMVLALATGAWPVLALVFVLAWVGAAGREMSTAPFAVAAPIMIVAGAIAAIPARRNVRRLALAAGAIALASGASLILDALALVAVVVAEAGDEALAIGSRARRGPARSGSLLSWRLTWRALGWRLIEPHCVALAPLVAGGLLIVNNPLEARVSAVIARVAAATATTLLVAGMADQILTRRPLWPWSRSLPSSAASRVAVDASLLALHALPVLIGVLLVAPGSLLPLAAHTGLLVVRAAGQIRSGRGRTSGASGPLLLEGFLSAAWIALVPWLGLIVAVALPLAFRAAARAERNARPSLFAEQHHQGAGDPVFGRSR